MGEARAGDVDVPGLPFDPEEQSALKSAAMPVEPLPANGSRTTPPGGVMSATNQRMSEIGLTVGWMLRRRRGVGTAIEQIASQR